MYNLPYAYAYALSDMRRITLVLMHTLIQPPSSYKSAFSYKTSDHAELTIQVHMKQMLKVYDANVVSLFMCLTVEETCVYHEPGDR